MESQLSFLLIKPDAVKRRLIGKIIERIEQKGLQIVAMNAFVPSVELAKEHYKEHVNKNFYEGLINFITSGRVVAIVVEGVDAVAVCRNLIGATDPLKSAAGTIRGDFGMSIGRNLIHGSDSVEAAKREISIWFGEVKAEKLFDEDLIYE